MTESTESTTGSYINFPGTSTADGVMNAADRYANTAGRASVDALPRVPLYRVVLVEQNEEEGPDL